MNIIYKRSARKTLALEITKELNIVVRLPLGYPQQKAEQFVASHRDWIQKHMARQAARQDKYHLSEENVEALRRKAKEIIPLRVAYFSALTGLTPKAVHITSAKTRFGSCSGKNSVNFSLYLMLYSAGAVDYVVLHELAHIRHKNHGKEFYRLIAKYMPDYKKYVKELRAR
ncbi:MAG: M48 family metallopeptidase [Clostridia bacterium]|nr:M48 family metallopeptidase [Clostridia bacterium]